MLTKRPIILLFVTLIMLILTQLITNAQDEPPAPQFLYRNDNHLVLLNGYTGTTSTLPIEVNEKDYFIWSPDGQYLMARLYQGKNNDYCLNLYDVDKQKWVDDKPISCNAIYYVFTKDGSQLYYLTNDKTGGRLWKYNIPDKVSLDIYETTKGEDYSDGISELNWSPTETYLTFEDYHAIMGGTLNSLIIMNVETEKYSTLNAPNTYYASYRPVWSPDDSWFLVTLQEEYVTSGSFPVTNQQGDLYLVRSETGKQYRLTYTPAEYEVDVHWTDDGKIAFTEVTEQKLTYTLDQAMNIEPVSPDKIIYPEPVDAEAILNRSQRIMISPDTSLGAWTSQAQQSDNKPIFKLNIGGILDEPIIEFSVPIADPFQSSNILIGWRPSNYPYPGG